MGKTEDPMDKIVQDKLRERIREEIQKRDEGKQVRLAERAGLDKTKLNKFLHGGRISITDLARIADAYNLSIDEMLDRPTSSGRLSVRDMAKMIVALDENIDMQFTYTKGSDTVFYPDEYGEEEALTVGGLQAGKHYYECRLVIPLKSMQHSESEFAMPDYSRYELNGFITDYARIKRAFPDQYDSLRLDALKGMLQRLSDIPAEEEYVYPGWTPSPEDLEEETKEEPSTP